jgi:hypothetical protein
MEESIESPFIDESYFNNSNDDAFNNEKRIPQSFTYF